MIRNFSSSLVVMLLLNSGSTSAAEPKRKAVIEDTAGVKTDLLEVGFSGNVRRFNSSYGSIAVLTKPLEVAIHLDNLKSIKTKGKEHEITYIWLGQEKTLVGTLDAGEFSGKSEFGDIKMPTSKLKELVFSELPSTNWETVKKEMSKKPTYTLMLTDNTEVTVSDLRRHASYYSSEGYLIGGETRYSHYTDFCFKRGESEVTIEFAKLKSIEFGSEKTVTVTLASGTSAPGTLSSGRSGIDGFTGINEAGEFFVRPGSVKKIVFGSTKGGK